MYSKGSLYNVTWGNLYANRSHYSRSPTTLGIPEQNYRSHLRLSSDHILALSIA